MMRPIFTRAFSRREILLLCAAGAILNLVAIAVQLRLDGARALVVLNGLALGICLRSCYVMWRT